MDLRERRNVRSSTWNTSLSMLRPAIQASLAANLCSAQSIANASALHPRPQKKGVARKQRDQRCHIPRIRHGFSFPNSALASKCMPNAARIQTPVMKTAAATVFMRVAVSFVLSLWIRLTWLSFSSSAHRRSRDSRGIAESFLSLQEFFGSHRLMQPSRANGLGKRV